MNDTLPPATTVIEPPPLMPTDFTEKKESKK